ncbi:MAG TPA: histidine phosphatase family protein [Solirubrobacteraceae bacterium]|jgi:phosphohistidine phosphatase|nr:histidine phosphatase family protein [Solirubrobacteraceae bacterium]
MAAARQLWLLRHADAEPHGVRPDAERRLTERGRRQAEAAGRALAAMGVGFGAVLCSPKSRARETAELALARLQESQAPPLDLHPPLAGGFEAEQALAAVAAAEREGPVLLVGHEPDLSAVVAELTGARVDLKKGGLVALRLGGGGGELVLLLRPAELALIAGITLVEA